MIAFLVICYSLLYVLLFNKLKLIPKTNSAISAFVGGGVVLIGAVVFAWYTFSPVSQDARLHRYIIPIVPNVKGLIQDVEVQAYKPMEKGDVLFRIDPSRYEFSVAQAKASIAQFEAQRTLAELQVERARNLLKTQAAAQVDLDRWIAELDAATAAIASAEAQLGNAEWELEETVVRAPADGYAVNVVIRPGSFAGVVGVAATLPFISTEDNEIMASFSQSAIRNIQVGDESEFTFFHRPGQVYSGTVSHIIGVSASAQTTASGQLPTFNSAPPDRWVVRMQFDDQDVAKSLPQGTAGTATVYTQRGKPVHIISKVVMRINAWMAYLTSP
ncbi:MAG: efflux RND transporter periplasmic adaptor subunit [Halieaceae bacterium]